VLRLFLWWWDVCIIRVSLPRTRISTAGLRFSCAGPLVWNNLLDSVVNCDTLCCFTCKLKTYRFTALATNWQCPSVYGIMVLNKSKYCIVLYWQSDLLARPRCSCWAWVVTALVQPHHHDCHHQSSMLVHRYVALIILSILLLLWLILLLPALLLLLLLLLKLMMMKYWHHLIPVLTGTSGATLNSRYSHLSHFVHCWFVSVTTLHHPSTSYTVRFSLAFPVILDE